MRSGEPKYARLLQPDMIVALSAVVIGVCALAVSVFQAQVMREQSRLMQEQQHAAVWPRLVVSRSNVGGALRFEVENAGIGPAQVRHVEVTVDGEPQQDWSGVIQALGAESVRYVQSTLRNRIIGSGEEVEVVTVSSATSDLYRESNRVRIAVCYCSVYERCWALAEDFSDGTFALPQPVEHCPDGEGFTQ